MKLWLLGCDDDALRLVRYLVEIRGHHVARVCGVERLPAAWVELLPNVPLESSWESLLGVTSPALVVVSRGESLESRFEALRALTQAEVPLLIVHPGCTAIAGLELDMIRRDSGALVTPYIPGLWHPALQQLVALIRGRSHEASPLGECHRLNWERRMPAESRPSVFAQLARDSAVLRCLAGDLQRVTAIGSPATGDQIINLIVNLSAPDDRLAQWNLLPDVETAAQLTLIGTQGRAVLEMPARGAPWTLVLEGSDPGRQSFPADADLLPFATWLETQTQGSEPTPRSSSSEFAYSWEATTRDLEVMETAEISLRRGRALDLQAETPTVEATFKAMMAAGGCGLLLLTLLIIGVLAVVGGLELAHQSGSLTPAEAEPQPYSLWLRLWPIYPFAAFLVLQLLLMVAKGSAKKR